MPPPPFALRRTAALPSFKEAEAGGGVEAAWESKQLAAEERRVEKEMDEAKKKYKHAKHHVHRHPHAAMRAQRDVARAALKKIDFIRTKKTAKKSKHPETFKSEDLQSSASAQHNMFQRSHSILGRFNPGEGKEHYEHRRVKHLVETMVWMKFKVLVNKVMEEKAEEIETVWEVNHPSRHEKHEPLSYLESWHKTMQQKYFDDFLFPQKYLEDHPEAAPGWHVPVEAQWKVSPVLLPPCLMLHHHVIILTSIMIW